MSLAHSSEDRFCSFIRTHREVEAQGQFLLACGQSSTQFCCVQAMSGYPFRISRLVISKQEFDNSVFRPKTLLGPCFTEIKMRSAEDTSFTVSKAQKNKEALISQPTPKPAQGEAKSHPPEPHSGADPAVEWEGLQPPYHRYTHGSPPKTLLSPTIFFAMDIR